jgi:EAL domain-containing protein (putative c-di-GMP-specific phosphodiesterase class I)
MLTEIILHKTCQAVKALIQEGYVLNRVSVNVSAIELKENEFCDDIIRIIRRSSLSGERIAIELTESRNESDFMRMKDKIDELKQLGIKFYLDDFGTGYSNMERIMALPFDIIKFDRSLVMASGDSERSRQIVGALANMFSEMNYSVLYEGVEKDSDEAMCRDMGAVYLQGYKYARPVPIEKLRDYLEQTEAA